MLDFTPLPQPFLLHSIHLVLHSRLCKALFELKQAPVLACPCLASVSVDEQQVGTHRQHDGTFDSVRLLPDLHASPMEPTFQLFDREFHSPSDGLVTQNRACTGIEEIGPDALDALRPTVAPFLGAYARAIAQLRQRGGA